LIEKRLQPACTLNTNDRHDVDAEPPRNSAIITFTA
jgi:hypothetical protein